MNDPQLKPYRDFGPWITEQIGAKAQKISVNAGFTCPNRDGTLGRGGCTYCNNQTFNPAYCQQAKSVGAQLEEGIAFFSRKYPQMKYLAYFQAYTNTYAPLPELQRRYEEALAVPGVAGIVIATRADCVSGDVLDYLSELQKRAFVLVEYGIESTDDAVLQRINRGHDFAAVQRAVEQTAKRGIPCGGHLILGLPTTHQIANYIEQEAARLNALPLTTLKIHQLQIVRGTAMEREFRAAPQDFPRYSLDEYLDCLVRFIRLLRPSLVLERFVSQSPPELLAVPGWGLKNHEFVARLHKRLQETDSWQGKDLANNN